MDLTGSIVALVTPFNSDGSVNLKKVSELVRWHIDKGTDGIVALGTTGESSTMSHEEDAQVVEACLAAADGRIPIIAGSGSNSTETMLEKSLDYEKMGVDGLLLITPYYNKSNAEGIYRHFTTVADAVKIPCILYNVPSRTTCEIPLSKMAELAAHPNVYGIKEASGNISYTAHVARHISPEFRMYSGNDDQIVPLLSLGGSGVISVLANILPTETHEIVAKWMAGDIEGACELQLKYVPFVEALFSDVNPIPIKEAMNLVGMEVGGYRLPLYEMSQPNQTKMVEIMRQLGLL